MTRTPDGPDSATVQSQMQRFIEFLRRRRKKVTRERLDILYEVLTTDTHFEAEDLLIRMRQEGKRVSKATIYRTLPLLIEAGLLRQSFRAGEKQTYYENTLGPKTHEHMICVNCGKVIEFTSPRLERALEEVTYEYRFLAERRRIEIYGLCADCSGLSRAEDSSEPSDAYDIPQDEWSGENR